MERLGVSRQKLAFALSRVLSEAEEKVINLKDTTGAQALNNLYDTITNKFSFTITVDGETKTLTRDALMVYARDARAEVREAAYKELYRVYADNGPLLAQIYGYVVRDWRNEGLDLRGYKSPISIRNLANDLPDGVVDTLLRVLDACANVVGIKDASGNVLFCQELMLKARGRIVDLSGDDPLTLPLMAVGSKGVISVTSNLYPRQVGEVVADALAGKWADAERKNSRTFA